MKSRPKAIAGAVIGIVAAIMLVITVRDEPEGQTYVIESSYTFDVTNPRYVAGYADAVVLGTVVEVVETLVGQHRTLYSLQVQEALKGGISGSIVVGQVGYIDGGDRHVPADQPMLQAGHTYLLAITRAASNQYTVIGGSAAVTDLNGVDRAALVRRWTEAVSQQQYPPGLPPKVEP